MSAGTAEKFVCVTKKGARIAMVDRSMKNVLKTSSLIWNLVSVAGFDLHAWNKRLLDHDEIKCLISMRWTGELC